MRLKCVKLMLTEALAIRDYQRVTGKTLFVKLTEKSLSRADGGNVIQP